MLWHEGGLRLNQLCVGSSTSFGYLVEHHITLYPAEVCRRPSCNLIMAAMRHARTCSAPFQVQHHGHNSTGSCLNVLVLLSCWRLLVLVRNLGLWCLLEGFTPEQKPKSVPVEVEYHHLCAAPYFLHVHQKALAADMVGKGRETHHFWQQTRLNR